MEDVRKKAWLNHAISKAALSRATSELQKHHFRHGREIERFVWHKTESPRRALQEQRSPETCLCRPPGLPHDYMQLLRPTKDPTSAWHETVSGSSATVSAELAHRLDQQECSLDSRLLNFQELAETASKYDAITGDVFRMSKVWSVRSLATVPPRGEANVAVGCRRCFIAAGTPPVVTHSRKMC
eukprot:scaffold3202_cov407-Prasinococcus_capsulatus_cf.AAC.12